MLSRLQLSQSLNFERFFKICGSTGVERESRKTLKRQRETDVFWRSGFRGEDLMLRKQSWDAACRHLVSGVLSQREGKKTSSSDTVGFHSLTHFLTHSLAPPPGCHRGAMRRLTAEEGPSHRWLLLRPGCTYLPNLRGRSTGSPAPAKWPPLVALPVPALPHREEGCGLLSSGAAHLLSPPRPDERKHIIDSRLVSCSPMLVCFVAPHPHPHPQNPSFCPLPPFGLLLLFSLLSAPTPS